MLSLKQQSCKTPSGPRLKNVPIGPAGSPPPQKKAKTTQEASDCASGGLVGLINWLMIAPFLITRVDSENWVDNWIREISPRASQMAYLIRRFLAWQGRKQPFRIPRWQKVFFWSLVPLHMVPYRAASCQQTCMNWCCFTEQRWRKPFLTTPDGQKDDPPWFMVSKTLDCSHSMYLFVCLPYISLLYNGSKWCVKASRLTRVSVAPV